MIGDCETAALVGNDGSIDWMCFPRFDSDACFAALLGGPEHGHWSLAPAGEITGCVAALSRRHADPGDRAGDRRGRGAAHRLHAAAPRRAKIIRVVEGISGTVPMKMELVVRFDYGHTVPWMKRLADNALRAISGPHSLVLRSPVDNHGQDLTTVSEFSVRQGDRVPFVLTYQASHLPPPGPAISKPNLVETERAWKEWCCSALRGSRGARRSCAR
jgi:hypothetical protein